MYCIIFHVLNCSMEHAATTRPREHSSSADVIVRVSGHAWPPVVRSLPRPSLLAPPPRSVALFLDVEFPIATVPPVIILPT